MRKAKEKPSPVEARGGVTILPAPVQLITGLVKHDAGYQNATWMLRLGKTLSPREEYQFPIDNRERERAISQILTARDDASKKGAKLYGVRVELHQYVNANYAPDQLPNELFNPFSDTRLILHTSDSSLARQELFFETSLYRLAQFGGIGMADEVADIICGPDITTHDSPTSLLQRTFIEMKRAAAVRDQVQSLPESEERLKILERLSGIKANLAARILSLYADASIPKEHTLELQIATDASRWHVPIRIKGFIRGIDGFRVDAYEIAPHAKLSMLAYALIAQGKPMVNMHPESQTAA